MTTKGLGIVDKVTLLCVPSQLTLHLFHQLHSPALRLKPSQLCENLMVNRGDPNRLLVGYQHYLAC